MLTSSSVPCPWHVALTAAVLLASTMTPQSVGAQGLVRGVQQGAAAGNKAAGPVGGVLGGAIGGVVGVVGGVLGVAGNNRSALGPVGGTARSAGGDKAKSAKTAKTGRAAHAAPMPPLTAAQIIATSDSNIDRLKRELNLTAEQDKHWGHFTSAMHYLGQNGAERLELRKARARRDPPDDIIEQMRNEAQFLYDRGADQRAVADAAEPLFAALEDRQKAIFVSEMVRLSNERGLD
jgi:hypothetical protein